MPNYHDQTSTSSAERVRKKGIYILPNLFTLSALFGGFYAIVMAMNGDFEKAAIGIFCAMVLDGLDGRVARMTGTQSAFGEQMDSLCDMVSFGVAPALVAYIWALKPLGRWGWIAAFVYMSCGALRLARFNVNTTVIDKSYFQGLPSPAAAALLTGFIWVMNDLRVAPANLDWVTFGITLFAGLTMVTNLPYYSFKDFDLKKSVPFIVIVLIALSIAAITTDPPSVLFGIFAVYAISGFAVYAWRKSKGMPTSMVALSKDEPEEQALHSQY